MTKGDRFDCYLHNCCLLISKNRIASQWFKSYLVLHTLLKFKITFIVSVFNSIFFRFYSDMDSNNWRKILNNIISCMFVLVLGILRIKFNKYILAPIEISDSFDQDRASFLVFFSAKFPNGLEVTQSNMSHIPPLNDSVIGVHGFRDNISSMVQTLKSSFDKYKDINVSYISDFNNIIFSSFLIFYFLLHLTIL